MKVLIAEDDELIRRGLVDILQGEGYDTAEAEDGQRALDLYETEKPDLLCLDVMMPKVSGYDVCRRIRAAGSEAPILFISAKSEEIDKVVGLELGADDFIVKPFGVREVIARIRAVTRRSFRTSAPRDLPDSFSIADLEVLPAELRAKRGDETIELSLREVKLLRLFADHPGKVLSREKVFEACWDEKYFPLSRTLDQHISKLRRRIEAGPKARPIIETVHGVGYRYDPQ